MYAELKITLHKSQTNCYPVILRYNQPDNDAQIAPISGKACFDLKELRSQELNTDAYAQTLTQALFQDPNLIKFYTQVSSNLNTNQLRIRLFIDSNAPELHALRWELLRDPETNAAFSTSERIVFSRFIAGTDFRPIILRPKGQLRALIAVASGTNLDKYNLATIDVAEETQRAQVALGAIPVEVLSGTVTLGELIQTIRTRQPDILYLVAHGTLIKDQSIVYLQNEQGYVQGVKGLHLAERLQEFNPQYLPRLIVIASCQSAGNSATALAPLLNQAGVPAILAMQGNISMATVEKLMPVFFSELLKDGQIDRALAVARGMVRDELDAWMPAVFLRLKGGRLWNPGEIDKDIIRLQSKTKETLSRIEHLSYLKIPGRESPFVIDRACTQLLIEHASQHSFLLIGEPGAGKSGAIHSAASKLIEKGYPVVVLTVDSLPMTSLTALKTELELQNTLSEVLANWVSDKPGILFIDALDASRGGESENVFCDLLRLIKKISDWRVVASIRSFDLKFGVKFREIFSGSPIDENFSNPEFQEIQHLAIPSLSEQDIQQILNVSPLIKNIYDNSQDNLRKLLHSPFNLHLLTSILSLDDTEQNITEIPSQLELLDRYWSVRLNQTGGATSSFEKEDILRIVIQQMIDNHSLSVRRSELRGINNEHLSCLLSDGILIPTKSRGDQIIYLGFSHHMLFDYALARLILEGGYADDFSERLTVSDDHALLMAPAAIVAFRMLWENVSERDIFWNVTFLLAGTTNQGSFSRMLPARILAELTKEHEDFAPVIARLNIPNKSDYTAAVFLTKHCFGALLAGVISDDEIFSSSSPWCSIAREISETAIADFAWSLNVVLHEWLEKPERLAVEQRKDLGIATRHLLNYGLTPTYQEHLIPRGIQGVCRTFDTAPDESQALLLKFLDAEHVKRYGYKDLRWFAYEFNSLVQYAPSLLAEVYLIAYTTTLPSTDELTRMGGSLIIPLTSNKQQDFKSVLYQLGEKFNQFVGQHPRLAAVTLIDIILKYTQDHHPNDDKDICFFIEENEIFVIQDWSCIWWQPEDDDRGHDSQIKLLNQFIRGLDALLQNDAVEEVLAVSEVVLDKETPAAIWTALLHVGKKHPEFGKSLLPLLTYSEFISCLDLRKASGDLIKQLYPMLSIDNKTQVEHAIINIERKETQAILLGCLQREYIADNATRQRISDMESENPLPDNSPPYSFSISREYREEEYWWWKERGVDPKDPVNAALLQTLDTIRELKLPDSLHEQRNTFVAQQWPLVITLYQVVNSNPALNEALQKEAWDSIAKSIELAAELSANETELANFPGLGMLLFSILDDTRWLLQSDSESQEAKLESYSGWNSPRVPAASALMLLARAKNKPCADLRERIKHLSKDYSPIIRSQILCRLDVLFNADPELMWELCETTFTTEKNKAVITVFLSSLQKVLSGRPEWIADKVIELGKAYTKDEIPDLHEEHDLDGVIVLILLQLWRIYKQQTAEQDIRHWLTNPIRYGGQIIQLLLDLRNHIALPKDKKTDFHQYAIELIHTLTVNVTLIFNNLAASSRNEEQEKQAEVALRILDQAVLEIYFGSGAYDYENQKKDVSTLDLAHHHQLLCDLQPSLSVLAEVMYPSVTHYLLETLEYFVPADPVEVFRLIIKALIDGGKHGGYQYESLGAGVFVRLIKRYLADHRSIFSKHEDCRHGLIQALNIFVEADWPEARQLVYQLPEFIR